ncbi:glycosyltransferase family 2 protein [Jannaschia sp. R86511]|uniref:glycosyltransferase family 2 protein n=1 Tax=Jannaschia sp. R86511 TaxID=3093853 RepID=UPI0036D2D1C3
MVRSSTGWLRRAAAAASAAVRGPSTPSAPSPGSSGPSPAADARPVAEVAPGLDPFLHDLAQRAVRDAGPVTVTAMAMRTRSPDLVELLGHVGRTGDRPRWLLGEATALAALPEPGPRTRALDTMLEVRRSHGAEPFDARQELVLAQLLLLHDRDEELRALLPSLARLPDDQVAHLLTDLGNPRRRPAADVDAWRRAFLATWADAGLLVPEVAPGPAAFDTLTTAPDVARAARDDLPRRLAEAGVDTSGGLPVVSVVVSAFRPDEGLGTAVRSLLDQTWPELDVVVVDDASGPDYADVLAEVAALPRVRVLTQPVNGGSYAARRRGLAEATGRYVTFHDSDDWAHPERVERQLVPMLLDPGLPGTHSLAMRALDDLDRTWLGYPAVRTNASSLLLDREVLATTGPFDLVRKSADSEFAARLETVLGRECLTVPEVLAVTRLRAASLSRGDFAMGWARAARIGYQDGYRGWHRRLGDGADPTEIAGPERPFAAPRSYLAPASPTAGAAGGPDGPADVLLVADLCGATADGTDLAGLVTALADDGLRVLLLHQEDPRTLRRPRRPAHPTLQRLLDAGRATRVFPEENMVATTVCVLSPACLVLRREPPRSLRADRVVVVDENEGVSVHARARLQENLSGWTSAPVTVVPGEVRRSPAALVGLVRDAAPEPTP